MKTVIERALKGLETDLTHMWAIRGQTLLDGTLARLAPEMTFHIMQIKRVIVSLPPEALADKALVLRFVGVLQETVLRMWEVRDRPLVVGAIEGWVETMRPLVKSIRNELDAVVLAPSEP